MTVPGYGRGSVLKSAHRFAIVLLFVSIAGSAYWLWTLRAKSDPSYWGIVAVAFSRWARCSA